VQRNRHDQVGLGQKLTAGARHPSAYGRCKIEAVAIFEGMNKGAGDLVIAHGGRCPMIGRRIGNRLHGQDAGSRIIDKRNPQPLADSLDQQAAHNPGCCR
jgi:hypothetical protein